MARSKLSHGSAPKSAPAPKPAAGQSYHDRCLCDVSPNSQQFEPTPQNPVPQHKRMAGMG